MNKKIAIALIIATAITTGYFYFKDRSTSPANGQPSSSNTKYFEKQMIEQGIARLGVHPIEGFNAEILIQAFPGLKPQDFDGVETFEGKYEFENNELAFRRTKSQPISSAETTISTTGYAQLLVSVSKRLNITVTDRASIDLIIQKLTL